MIRPGLYRVLVGMLWAWPGCRVLVCMITRACVDDRQWRRNGSIFGVFDRDAIQGFCCEFLEGPSGAGSGVYCYAVVK